MGKARWSVAAVAAIVAPLALIAPASGAPGDVSALDCSHSHSDKTSATGKVKTAGDPLIYRAGPHKSCAALGQVRNGTVIRYHCWTTGQQVGNWSTWTWGQVGTTNHYGWFSDAYLDDHGAPAGAKC
jgi:hypothetical protein